MIRSVVVAVVVAATVGACTSGGGGTGTTTTTAPTTTTTTISLATSLCRGQVPQQIGTLADPALVEASGVVESRAHSGVLWVHNDSGDTARVFAITKAGATVRQYALSGATAVDWEDIAILRGVNGATDTLFLGDIGDNAEARSNIVVYSTPEPDPATDARASIPATALTLTYPDGPHNAEAMFVDPATRELFIVTKAVSGTSEVYRTPDANLAGNATLVHVGTLDLGLGELVTGGDISDDGSAIALRTYTSVFVWSRQTDETVDHAFTGPKCDAPAPTERQSEAIAIDPDGHGYITTSEGANAPIWHIAA